MAGVEITRMAGACHPERQRRIPVVPFADSQIQRFFAEFTLTQMKKILRCAQDDKRRAQNDRPLDVRGLMALCIVR